MRIMAIGLLVPTALVLAACPGPDDPEDVEVPPAAEQAQFESLQGSGVTGEVSVTPRDNETHIVVSLRNAPADETFDARIHSGTCQNPGPEIRNIGSIRTTDMGDGAIDTTVGEAPALILDGNHIAVIWGPARRDGDLTGTTGTTGTTAQDRAATGTQPAGTGTQPATGTRTDQADAQTGAQYDTGLVRDDRWALACTTLPRHTQTGTPQR
jgi:hypothetical protein